MVLIVDDKAENIFSLRRTLELSGFEVDSAQSGEEALKKILRQQYTLIILDVQMPGMDGFEVAEAISGYSKAKDIPIIFLSAVVTEKKFITKGYTSGGVDYVTKPVDPDIFLLKVKTLHRLYEQHRELQKARTDLLEEVAIRKHAEQRLQHGVQELRSILEALPQLAFTLRPDGSIEFTNSPWYLFAAKNEMPSFHLEDSHVYEMIRRNLETRETLVAELRILHQPSSTYRWHLLRITPVLQDGSVSKWVGTFTDIQEQKAASDILESKVRERTEELLEKNKELESSNHELQQFASVASHDLKEPLRKIQVFGSIIKERMSDAAPQAVDGLDRIIEASQRMSILINDLLDYSRLSVDNFFQRTDLSEIVNETLRDLEYPISEKAARIRVSPLPVIDAIPGQMRQVFQNLLSNSLKFVSPGVQPVIEISATPIRAGDIELCCLEIRDNGIGFDQQYAEKIFTIFQRLNSRQEYEGTGIGLAIVKKIVEKHRGTVAVRSAEGSGTTFSIALPVFQHPIGLISSTESHPIQHT
jgi:signal transduction histidine kinase/ActR/RegA family two-component response regulator